MTILEAHLYNLENQIRFRTSHYYSVMESLADAPIVDSMEEEASRIRKTLTEFINQFVDDQIGLELMSAEVTPDMIVIVATDPRIIGKCYEDENKEMGETLVDILDRDRYGKYILSVSASGIKLTRGHYEE